MPSASYPVRCLEETEIPDAAALIWEVFLQFEAPEYPEEGVRTFRELLDNQDKLRRLRFYGAFDGSALIGVICVREPQHIGGFFVKAAYHRQGVGRALFENMKADYEKQEFTVNSSPYAVPVYEHLGFTAEDTEQLVDGIRFTPMRYRKTHHVRCAEIGDIPRILELLVQVDMVHHNGRPDLFQGPATKYNAEQLAVIVQDPKTPVFVCTDASGKVIGHAFCVHKQVVGDPVLTDVRTLYIDDICVEETARGSGAGRALYQAVLAYARESGFYNITLNVWSCNPGAVKFYEAMGLVPQKICMEQIL